MDVSDPCSRSIVVGLSVCRSVNVAKKLPLLDFKRNILHLTVILVTVVTVEAVVTYVEVVTVVTVVTVEIFVKRN